MMYDVYYIILGFLVPALCSQVFSTLFYDNERQ